MEIKTRIIAHIDHGDGRKAFLDLVTIFARKVVAAMNLPEQSIKDHPMQRMSELSASLLTLAGQLQKEGHTMLAEYATEHPALMPDGKKEE